MKTIPTYNLELELKNKGYQYIVGVDEAGRGPLAGPVVAAAVYIPEGFDTTGIDDSKKLSSKNRELFYNKITESCAYSHFAIDNKLIDEINILEATKLAMRFSIQQLIDSPAVKDVYVIVDGNFLPDGLDVPAKCVIGGDGLSVSIAAASIIAKVWRDRVMDSYNRIWPAYGFNTNRGYGTKHHREVIEMIGPCSIHRKSFRRVKEYV